MGGRTAGMTREQRNARNKYLAFVNERGVYMWRDPGPFRERLRLLYKHMSFAEIAALTSIPQSTLKDHHYNERTKVHVDSVNRLFALPVPQSEAVSNTDRKRGAVRIIHGLLARGFSMLVMTDFLPCTYMSLSNLSSTTSRCWDGMSPEMYAHFLAMAEKLEKAQPKDFGVAGVTQNMNKSRARNNRWAPIGCWDLDTVHRADAFAEWTGACGTAEGYQLHKTYGIHVEGHGPRRDRIKVLCEPCRLAKREETAVSYNGVRADAVYDALDQGHTMREIAAKFHCSLRTVQRYRHEWAETRGES